MPYRKEVPVVGCLLGFSEADKVAKCGAYRKCPGCGWQAAEDEKRRDRVRRGEFVRDPETGCKRLIVSRAWFVPTPTR